MPRKSASETSLEVFRTLQWLRKNKFTPVPLLHQSKSAAVRDYHLPSYKPPPDDYWTKHNYGIGCLTGPPGPVDIDLDCASAVHFAPYFLPKTQAVFGRASKKASHYLYRVEEEEFGHYKYQNPQANNSSIVEARGQSKEGGQQTVFPGSLHADTGEPISWTYNSDPEVTTVKSDVLLLAVRKIALASLLIDTGVFAPAAHNEPLKFLSGIFYWLHKKMDLWPFDEADAFLKALMEHDGDRDRGHARTCRATYAKGDAGTPIVGSGEMRKWVKDKKIANLIMAWAGSQSSVIVDEYNEHYAVVRIGGKLRIANFDVRDAPMLMPQKDFLEWRASDLDTDPDTKKPVQRAKLWLANRERRAYGQVEFLPGEEAPSDTLNLWSGWEVQPSKEGSCDAWLQLLRDVICGGDEQLNAWMLNWFCNILREPQRKSMTAPVLIGRQGVGKTQLFEYFGMILGRSYICITQAEQIHGKHNSHLQNVLLLHSEEAVFGGDRKHLSVIKSMITDNYQMIEPKTINAYRVRNFMRLALTSNEIRAAPVQSSDRRFTVIDMGERTPSDELVKALIKERDNCGPARLFQFFNDFSYDPTIPRVNIKNNALAEMKAQNWDPVQEWWHDTLEQGVILPDELRKYARTVDELQKDWPKEVSSRALYVSLVVWWQNNRKYGSPPSDTLLSFRLDKFVGMKLERKQMWGYEKPMRSEHEPPMHPLIAQLSERQSTITNMPSLDQCRQAFERHVGQAIRWTEADVLPFVKPTHRRF